jgi:molybdate transport system regulatory protein
MLKIKHCKYRGKALTGAKRYLKIFASGVWRCPADKTTTEVTWYTGCYHLALSHRPYILCRVRCIFARHHFRLLALTEGPVTTMSKLKLKSSYWIVNENNQIIIGKGRMEILDNIEKTGSINQAAKAMKMSYKAVWSKIKFTERHLNAKIVDANRKTGTRLTREGKNLLENYRRLHDHCIVADNKIFESIF